MTGQFMLEVEAATEELPVGVLDELLDHRLIRFIEEILQIMQTDQQSSWQAGTPDSFGIEGAELRLEARPINGFGQPVQWMLMRGNQGQTDPGRVIRGRFRGLRWTH